MNHLSHFVPLKIFQLLIYVTNIQSSLTLATNSDCLIQLSLTLARNQLYKDLRQNMTRTEEELFSKTQEENERILKCAICEFVESR